MNKWDFSHLVRCWRKIVIFSLVRINEFKSSKCGGSFLEGCQQSVKQTNITESDIHWKCTHGSVCICMYRLKKSVLLLISCEFAANVSLQCLENMPLKIWCGVLNNRFVLTFSGFFFFLLSLKLLSSCLPDLALILFPVVYALIFLPQMFLDVERMHYFAICITSVKAVQVFAASKQTSN